MSGADITATVTFVPRSPGTVGHLKLIVKQEREGRILGGERNRKQDLVWCQEEERRGEEKK